MRFRQMQEILRKIIKARVDAGELTGLRLAQQTGFQQAHISNFLNGKRYLSVGGMDKVLQVQKLSTLDLLDPHEINKRASIVPPSPGDFEDVVLAEGAVAAREPRIIADQVQDILKFKRSFLRRLKAEKAPERADWQRFVLIKVDARDGMSMYPRLLPGAMLLLDRHYISLTPYRRHEPNMYAVRAEGGCTVKYVELSGDTLILRPHNQTYPVSVIALEGGKPSDHLVGRVCHVSIET